MQILGLICPWYNSYRPTDLSLLNEFSKNVSFGKIYIFHYLNLSKQWPLTSSLTTYYDYSKIMPAQLHTKYIFHDLFVSSISDLFLLKEFCKNVNFSNSCNFPHESAVQKLSMSTHKQSDEKNLHVLFVHTGRESCMYCILLLSNHGGNDILLLLHMLMITDKIEEVIKVTDFKLFQLSTNRYISTTQRLLYVLDKNSLLFIKNF